MILDLIQIEDADHRFSVDLVPEEIVLEEDAARLKRPVRFAGSVRKGIAQVDVTGEIKGEIEIDCTRCLRPTDTELDVGFTAVYVTPENYTEEKESELRATDLDVAIFEGDKIDLADLAREQIVLNLPTRFLCSEDCKGLCPKCGANLNTDACDCEQIEIDPRWAGLKDFQA